MSVDEVEKAQGEELRFECKDCDKRSGCRYRFYGCRHCGEKCETQTDGQKLWIECEKCGMRGPNTESNECDAWYYHCKIPSADAWSLKSFTICDTHDGMEDGVYLQITPEGVTAAYVEFSDSGMTAWPARYSDFDNVSPELDLESAEEVYFIGPVNDRMDTDLFPVFAAWETIPRDETGKQIKECCTGKPWEDEYPAE